MRKLALYLALLVLVAVFVEAASWLAGQVLRTKGVFYVAQAVGDYEAYLRERDPVTGWPTRFVERDPQRDPSGSRPLPAFPEPGNACLSLYGDSFTFGAGVDDAHAWGNVLAGRLGCRVANYAAGGFGSDQALLRFLHRPDDEAPVVLLGHLTENVLRNVNRFRDLLYPGTTFGLKPRFVVAQDGGLALVPLPTPTREEFLAIVARPEDHLEHEFFLPGGPAGVRRLGFPYTLSVLGAFRHFHVIAALKGEPWYAGFYAPEHPSRGLEVTARIFEAFVAEAERRGKVAVLAVIPTGMDLEYFRADGRWSHSPLVERAARSGLEVLDIGPGMLERIGDRDPCVVFTKEGCSGHPDEQGYAIVADVVYEHLEASGLIPDPLGPHD